jgi:hypothetical protein
MAPKCKSGEAGNSDMAKISWRVLLLSEKAKVQKDDEGPHSHNFYYGTLLRLLYFLLVSFTLTLPSL